MGYLTAEWEEMNLRKKSDKALDTEYKFLIEQVKHKRWAIFEYTNRIQHGHSPNLPLWMIISDIESVCDQLIRVVDELKRRELP